MSAGPAIVLRRPPEAKPTVTESLTKLMVPLEFPVWLMTVLAFLVTSTVLYLISHTNPYEWRRMAKDKEATLREAESFTCINTFWFVISTMAWQGFVRTPRSMGGRITVTAWWFFVLIFLLSYTACLTNYLRVGPAPMEVEGYSRIKSFSDLSKNDELDVAMVDGGATSMYFQKSRIEGDSRLYDKHVQFQTDKQHITSYQEGIKYLRSRPFLDFAFIMETPAAKFAIHQKPCNLYMISDHRVTVQLAIAISKSSTYLPFINQALLRLHEDGSLSALENKWFEAKCAGVVFDSDTEVYKVPPFYQMDLGTFSGAILILVCGLVLGGLISLIELCIYKWAESHPDDDEAAVTQIGHNDLATSENLLSADMKKGGATQV